MKRILITGARGYIGSFLTAGLKEQYDVVSTDISGVKRDSYIPCDLTSTKDTEYLISRVSPDVLVHCAGTKDLSNCEKEPETAFRLNVELTKNLLNAVGNRQMKVIFLSSDYVFSGERGRYREDELPVPVTVYGKNKLECERYVQMKKDVAICRTASVYGYGSKFFEFILGSLKENRSIDMYTDSFFSPTCIANLLVIIDVIIQKDKKGIFHTAGRERLSRYDFSLKVAGCFNFNPELIIPSNRPSGCPLAKDSSLETKESMNKLGMEFMDVNEGLEWIRRQGCISLNQK